MTRKQVVLSVGAAIVAFALFLVLFNGAFDEKSTVQQAPQQATDTGEYATKTSSGAVTIDLTPEGVKDGKLVFHIGVNTHSVALEQYDLKNLTLLDYGGTTIEPAYAPQLSGHHNSGTISFPVDHEQKTFKVIIRGIPDSDERVFEWP